MGNREIRQHTTIMLYNKERHKSGSSVNNEYNNIIYLIDSYNRIRRQNHFELTDTSVKNFQHYQKIHKCSIHHYDMIHEIA